MVYILLGKTKPKKPSHGEIDDPYWKAAMQMLNQSDFNRRMLALNAWNMDDNKYQAASLMLQDIKVAHVVSASAVAKVKL